MAGPDPVPWTSRWRRVKDWKKSAPANRIEATFENVRRVTIDSRAACLESTPLRYSVETDGPVTLWFSDGRVLSLGKGRSSGTLASRP